MTQDLHSGALKILPANLAFCGEEEIQCHCQPMGRLPQQSKALEVLPADLY